MTIEEFSQIFPDKQVPYELSMLLTFEQQYGRYMYSKGFSLSIKGGAIIAGWSKENDFLKRLIPFANANEYGAVYACWDDGNNKPVNEMPVVVFGDEGGVYVMAQHIVELLQLLTCDKRIAVSYNGVSYKDSGSLYASSYRNWVNEQFNISAIDNPLPIIQNAQDAFKVSFDAWLTQYTYTTITEKEAEERFQLADYIDTFWGDEYRYILLEGNVVMEGFVDLNTLCRAINTYGIIVDGNLTITGGLLECEMDYGETLFVMGDLQAKSISKGGGEFYIKGNLMVEQTIYSFLNQGQLTVEGNTTATTIFSEDQYFKFGGDVQGLLISTGKIEGLRADFDTTEPLLDELIEDDKNSDHATLLQYVHDGKPITKEKYR
ncbi:hypothetical protein SAMN05518672_111168 [Chitinophaga sp. CF118]|uniref:hypothetical protein n=1 Tax=Chitinophaga sp. CF118 TaxID=1884367 RepID=UPI0008E14639|nr:hypothetical protein [Chitinophaga sp. CF118]SFE88605.1 hypothetical protein SAMN05518672_111168 [Chitinophaga sp. CF118]